MKRSELMLYRGCESPVGESRVRDLQADYWTPSYLSAVRFDSYRTQVELVRSTNAVSVLEIGPGPGVVSHLLQQMGMQVTTLDVNPSINSDIHADVRDLCATLSPRSFDCVLAAQVLEHMAWEDSLRAIAAFAEVARKWCVVSVPYAGITINPSFGWGRSAYHVRSMCLRVPAIWRREPLAKDEHHWELGIRGYSRRKFRRALRRRFVLTSESLHRMNGSQVFYLLRLAD